jgi:hypothetical protein
MIKELSVSDGGDRRSRRKFSVMIKTLSVSDGGARGCHRMFSVTIKELSVSDCSIQCGTSLCANRFYD